MFFPVLVIFVLATLYWFPVRRWLARWGTTSEELTRPMAGDAILPNPTHWATHAVTIEAPPDDIWPWLVQLGYRRGGLYSYDWLDQLFGILDGPSAHEVLTAFQQLAVGDKIRLGPRQELTVAALHEKRALVLRYSGDEFQWVWQFGLYPLNEQRTRLISRGTERYKNSAGAWLFMRVMEPAAFVMTRRMLLNVKHRAEARRAARTDASQTSRRVAA
jgi:hypothetical protein